MSLDPKALLLALPETNFGLSARRLWEHTELHQVNPFGAPVRDSAAADAFIDVVRTHERTWSLAGATLAEVRAGAPAARDIASLVAAAMRSTPVSRFERKVADHIALVQQRIAARVQEDVFLRSAPGALAVPLLFSRLQERLRAVGERAAPAEQWRGTINNMRQHGVREEELARSGVVERLQALAAAGKKISGVHLADMCDFRELHLSVIPVVRSAATQLRFIDGAPQREVRSARISRKDKRLHVRTVARFDLSLGYRIEQVQQQALRGIDTLWQAVAPNGQVLTGSEKKSVLSPEGAAAVAAKHAATRYPKSVAVGRWSDYAWTGGENYREWLITLPGFPVSFFSSHFAVRNVLAHLRCDVREGADGERVLLLQEVQSDWAQRARRGEAPEPPFLQEWTSLALKLALLHAAQRQVDVLAWTTGAAQVQRYDGLGEAGLLNLYDRTLVQDATRILKPWRVACERQSVYVPKDFHIQLTEGGYEVRSAEGELLGTAETIEDGRLLLPDGAHEELQEVHAVRISADLRSALLEGGLPAWG